jgi:exonuclease VII large subunit
LHQQHKLLESYSYEGPLKRGYAYVTDEKGQVMRQKSQITEDDLKIHFMDGTLQVKTIK